MLKGNLLVGENQSVALYAESLEDLLKLADSHHLGSAVGPSRVSGKLRIDLAHDKLPIKATLRSSLSVDSRAPKQP